MYSPGDLIVYQNIGVCQVVGIAPLKELISDQRSTAVYYKLMPVYGTGFIYIPVNTDVFMRPVISREDAEMLIKRLPEIKDQAYSGGSNVTYIKKYYDTFLQTHDCEAFFQIIKGIYLKAKRNNKMNATEKAYMKRAENLLYGELAIALDMPKEDMIAYIDQTVKDVLRKNRNTQA